MKTSRFRLRLFFVLLAFALVVTFSITIADFIRLNERTIKDSENQIEQATEMVLYALHTVDKAYQFMDEDTKTKMEDYTYQLQEKYEANPDFESWDFATLAEQYAMDIYILDEGNKIIHSNIEDEIGLDFSECCKSFHLKLNERRESGELFVDGIDVDQKSGEVKKFSYMATKDKNYIIELGYSLENEVLFQEFNFLTIADEIVEDFSLIEDMNVLNYGGLPFGTVESANPSREHREAFEYARENNEIVELESTFHDKPAIYRYVPYVSTYDQTGQTQNKVVEVIYNKNHVDSLLQSNKNTLLIQLSLVLLVTIIVSVLIASWFAKPVYLAFHDSLTGLKNRAAFDDAISASLSEANGNTGLLMLDLDNFKLVNDFLGHDKGDYVLKKVAKSIQEAVGGNYNAFRLGGDEFAVIIPEANKKIVATIAEEIIDKVKKAVNDKDEMKMLNITVSIGISIAKQHTNRDDLYKQADIALYLSKEKGKNQFQIYSDYMESHMSFFY